MTAPNTHEFLSSKLDEMPNGVLSLWAPVESGTLQIHTGEPRAFARLIVARCDEGVSVQMLDGSPLQAEDNFVSGGNRAFAEPVPWLIFWPSRAETGSTVWHATGPGLEVASTEAFESLAYTVGDCVKAKKRKLARAAGR